VFFLNTVYNKTAFSRAVEGRASRRNDHG